VRQRRTIHSDTTAARARFLKRFEDEVDPHRLLPADERDELAKAARKRYFQELGRTSRRLAAIGDGRGHDPQQDLLRAQLRQLLSDVDLRAMIIVALSDGEVMAGPIPRPAKIDRRRKGIQ
jgi:hypothetical protein